MKSVTAQREVLLIGHSDVLMKALPRLLNRAGFDVDVITTSLQFRPLVPARDVTRVKDSVELLKVANKKSQYPYDLIVIGDDQTLREIIQSDLPDAVKLRLLPVCNIRNFKHVGNKIGLSQVLSEAGVMTPEFWVGLDVDQLVSLLGAVSYPVMVKNDLSGGGSGVFKYAPGDSLDALLAKPLVFPLLVQRFIDGDVLDLSGFYLNGELIHFSHAVSEAVVSNPFGPSSLRTYTQLACVPQNVFSQVKQLGEALGAHGFVNVACLRSHIDGKYYFVEADMRATVWAEYARYFGDDPAIAIKRYFDKGNVLAFPQAMCTNYPCDMVIPYVYRLTALQIMTNRYQVWRFCDGFNKWEITRYCVSRSLNPFKQWVVAQIKPRVNDANWQRLRQIWHVVIGKKAQVIVR